MHANQLIRFAFISIVVFIFVLTTSGHPTPIYPAADTLEKSELQRALSDLRTNEDVEEPFEVARKKREATATELSKDNSDDSADTSVSQSTNEIETKEQDSEDDSPDKPVEVDEKSDDDDDDDDDDNDDDDDDKKALDVLTNHSQSSLSNGKSNIVDAEMDKDDWSKERDSDKNDRNEETPTMDSQTDPDLSQKVEHRSEDNSKLSEEVLEEKTDLDNNVESKTDSIMPPSNSDSREQTKLTDSFPELVTTTGPEADSFIPLEKLTKDVDSTSQNSDSNESTVRKDVTSENSHDTELGQLGNEDTTIEPGDKISNAEELENGPLSVQEVTANEDTDSSKDTTGISEVIPLEKLSQEVDPKDPESLETTGITDELDDKRFDREAPESSPSDADDKQDLTTSEIPAKSETFAQILDQTKDSSEQISASDESSVIQNLEIREISSSDETDSKKTKSISDHKSAEPVFVDNAAGPDIDNKTEVSEETTGSEIAFSSPVEDEQKLETSSSNTDRNEETTLVDSTTEKPTEVTEGTQAVVVKPSTPLEEVSIDADSTSQDAVLTKPTALKDVTTDDKNSSELKEVEISDVMKEHASEVPSVEELGENRFSAQEADPTEETDATEEEANNTGAVLLEDLAQDAERNEENTLETDSVKHDSDDEGLVSEKLESSSSDAANEQTDLSNDNIHQIPGLTNLITSETHAQSETLAPILKHTEGSSESFSSAGESTLRQNTEMAETISSVGTDSDITVAKNEEKNEETTSEDSQTVLVTLEEKPKDADSTPQDNVIAEPNVPIDVLSEDTELGKVQNEVMTIKPADEISNAEELMGSHFVAQETDPTEETKAAEEETVNPDAVFSEDLSQENGLNENKSAETINMTDESDENRLDTKEPESSPSDADDKQVMLENPIAQDLIKSEIPAQSELLVPISVHKQESFEQPSDSEGSAASHDSEVTKTSSSEETDSENNETDDTEKNKEAISVDTAASLDLPQTPEQGNEDTAKETEEAPQEKTDVGSNVEDKTDLVVPPTIFVSSDQTKSTETSTNVDQNTQATVVNPSISLEDVATPVDYTSQDSVPTEPTAPKDVKSNDNNLSDLEKIDFDDTTSEPAGEISNVEEVDESQLGAKEADPTEEMESIEEEAGNQEAVISEDVSQEADPNESKSSETASIADKVEDNRLDTKEPESSPSDTKDEQPMLEITGTQDLNKSESPTQPILDQTEEAFESPSKPEDLTVSPNLELEETSPQTAPLLDHKLEVSESPIDLSAGITELDQVIENSKDQSVTLPSVLSEPQENEISYEQTESIPQQTPDSEVPKEEEIQNTDEIIGTPSPQNVAEGIVEVEDPSLLTSEHESEDYSKSDAVPVNNLQTVSESDKFLEPTTSDSSLIDRVILPETITPMSEQPVTQIEEKPIRLQTIDTAQFDQVTTSAAHLNPAVSNQMKQEVQSIEGENLSQTVTDRINMLVAQTTQVAQTTPKPNSVGGLRHNKSLYLLSFTLLMLQPLYR